MILGEQAADAGAHRRTDPVPVGVRDLEPAVADRLEAGRNAVLHERIHAARVLGRQARGGEVQETGDFELDGVTFPAAEIVLEFIDPAEEGEDEGGASMFPTGNLTDPLEVPGIGVLEATLINAGIPTVFINAADIGYTGTELQNAINSDAKALAMFESIRATGAVRMGLIQNMADAVSRQHTPKVAFVAPSADYTSSSGKHIAAADIDLQVRALSMGKLHHAMMGTCAVAIATAAAIPGTVVNRAAGGDVHPSVRFGHPSGTLRVGTRCCTHRT